MLVLCWLCSAPVTDAQNRVGRYVYDSGTGKRAGAIYLHIPCGQRLNSFLTGYKKHCILEYIATLRELR